VLLYPEKGLELNDAGARVAALCSAPRSVGEIVERMIAASDGATPPDQIEAEVLAFLTALEDRGLLVVHP
jgi:hypothetical protein